MGIRKDSLYRDGVFRMGNVRVLDLSGSRTLPLGNSDFRSAVRDSVVVDKSLLVADLFRSGSKATLFCRPRRFGKSLNLSMLHCYFEMAPADSPAEAPENDVFASMAIWDEDAGAFRKHHRAYPVIHLSFNNTKAQTWYEGRRSIEENIVGEYLRHGYLAESTALSQEERALFSRIAGSHGEDELPTNSLLLLSRLLFQHHGQRTVILIDEYDAPVMSASANHYYREAVTFMKMWLTGALKDNSALAFAVLTGVQRISKESIFSDLNNLDVNTSLNVLSDERYGFTGDEITALAAYLDASAAIDEVRAWYDGYRFGNVDVYNPWSVVNYFQKGCVADVYWGNTSSNSVLGDLVRRRDAATEQKLYALMEPGGVVREPLNLSVVFPDESEVAPGALWSMLYLAGYLTTNDIETPNNTRIRRALRIPNAEIRELYRTEIIERFSSIAGSRDRLFAFHEALTAGDAAAVAHELENILLYSASFFDLASENSYHMLVLGLLFGMEGYQDPLSNRESGRGRFDICVLPQAGQERPTIILELKFAKKADRNALESLARSALEQIEDKAYVPQTTQGHDPLLRYGIAASGKTVAVAVRR